jgi:hypothetical protein
MATLSILDEELFRLLLHGLLISQVGIFPDMLLIVLMKAFHIAIALGIADWGKE